MPPNTHRSTAVTRDVDAAVRQHIANGRLTINGRKLAHDLREPQDYVLYTLREHPLVNRHSIGDGYYQLLTDEPRYKQTPRRTTPPANRPTCPECFLPYPTDRTEHEC